MVVAARAKAQAGSVGNVLEPLQKLWRQGSAPPRNLSILNYSTVTALLKVDNCWLWRQWRERKQGRILRQAGEDMLGVPVFKNW